MIEGGGSGVTMNVDEGLVWRVLTEEVGRNSDAEDADARRASICGLRRVAKVTAIREGSSASDWTEGVGDFEFSVPGVNVS